MSHELLDVFKSEDFERELGVLVPANALRLVLGRNKHVRNLADALRVGTVTEQNIRDFLAETLRCLRTGQPLDHELAIAAIAVALEPSISDFATGFLADLGSLSIVEMSLSPRVAREVMKHRKVPPPTFRKTFEVEDAVDVELRVSCFVDLGETREPPHTVMLAAREYSGAT